MIKKLASTRVYAYIYIYIYTLLYIVIHDGSSTYVTRVRARWNVSPSRALSFSLCLCLFLSLYLSISSIIKSLMRRNFVELRLPCVWCAKMISKTSTFLRQSMVTRGMTLRAFAGSQTHRDSNVASDLCSGSLRMTDLRVDDDRNWSILLRCVTTTITTTMIATTARIVVAIWTLSRLPEKCRRACFGVRCHGGDDSRCTDYTIRWTKCCRHTNVFSLCSRGVQVAVGGHPRIGGRGITRPHHRPVRAFSFSVA